MNRYVRPLTILTAILALLSYQSPLADIYKTVDEDGKVIFTDTPKDKKAEPVDLPEVNTQPAIPITIKLSPPKDEKKKEERKPGDYKITMTAPANETTVTMGQMTLASKVTITPELEDGHKIQFYLDSTKQGKASTATNYTYKDLYRGTHSIHAAIVDKKGKVLKQSEAVTIYVHRPRVKGAGVSYGQI